MTVKTNRTSGRGRRGGILCLSLALAAALPGCFLPAYLADRGRDAADMFTLSFGVGLGAKVQVGPVQAGFLDHLDFIGWRYGTIAHMDLHYQIVSPIPWPQKGGWFSTRGDFTCFDYFHGDYRSVAGDRHKEYLVATDVPFWAPLGSICPTKFDFLEGKSCPAYYTQVEIIIALLPAVRVGFNPGEMLDFLLGWATIDIFDDDLEMKRWREEADKTKSPQPPRPPEKAPPPSPAAPPTSRPRAAIPADILDLSCWKLTLPVDTGRAGNPDEILQPELGRFELAPCFTLNAARDGVVFRAPCGGAATKGSRYPRAELRETAPGGEKPAAWSTTAGRHELVIRQAITRQPKAKPHVVAGQVHDAKDDLVMIRLEGKKLFVESGGKELGVLDPAYAPTFAYSYGWASKGYGGDR